MRLIEFWIRETSNWTLIISLGQNIKSSWVAYMICVYKIPNESQVWSKFWAYLVFGAGPFLFHVHDPCSMFVMKLFSVLHDRDNSLCSQWDLLLFIMITVTGRIRVVYFLVRFAITRVSGLWFWWIISAYIVLTSKKFISFFTFHRF